MRPARAKAKARSVGLVVLAVGGFVGLLFLGAFCIVFVLAAIIDSRSPGRNVATSTPTGWPTDFRAMDDTNTIVGAPATSFDERRADGSEQRIAVSIHAPRSFDALGVSRFSFEVCKLVNRERSSFRCSSEEWYVDSTTGSQKDAARTFIVRSGPGTYEARAVKYGAWGDADQVYASATFEVR